MKRKYTILTGLIFLILGVKANNVQITNVVASGNNLSFDISWENAWRQSETYHDAVWVFVKQKPSNQYEWSHANVLSGFTSWPLEVVAVTDQKGVYIRLSDDYAGDIMSSMVTLNMENLGLFPELKVFGIEMVYIPEGAFYLGDVVSEKTLGGYSEDSLDVVEPYQISHSGLLEVAQLDHRLWAKNGAIYNMDVPADFPNGYDASYCMKYEISMGQYVEFLNTLSREQQVAICPSDISGTTPEFKFPFIKSNTPTYKNGVTCAGALSEEGSVTFFMDSNNNDVYDENDDGHTQAMFGIDANKIMLLSYLDWACLRPMTEFEFEKICRGDNMSIPGEYAWGTTVISPIQDVQYSSTPDEAATNQGNNGLAAVTIGNPFIGKVMRCGIEAFDGSSRQQAGAGYYGVMNLTGNVSELCLNFSDHNIAFTESNGDGILGSQGFNETTWQNISLLGKGGNLQSSNYQLFGYPEVSGRATFVENGSTMMFGRGVRTIN